VNISVVVPARDEAASIDSVIDCLVRQTRPAGEIVVVDGGSTDATPDRVAAKAKRHPHVRLVRAGEATPGRARNVGAGEACSEWIAFTDAGTDVDANWLDRLARVAENDPAVDVVYGAYEPVVATAFEEAAALAYVGVRDATAVGPVRTRSIASCLVRKRVWEHVGGFPDLRAAEDRLFMASVDAAGFNVALAPEAVVRWQLQPTLAGTFARFRLYSKHNVLAGQQANWHQRLLGYYVIGAVFLLLGTVRRRVLLVPAAGFLARVVRGIWERSDGRSPLWALQPLRVMRVAAVLVTVDAATFAGWIEALVARPRGDR